MGDFNQLIWEKNLSSYQKKGLKFIFLGAIFLFLAVGLGAFGAHGLEKVLTPKSLETFKTGVTYQFYHGLGLLGLGIIQTNININLSSIAYLFFAGIILFCFNCYLYSITQIKFLAMIVPFGGVSFLTGWALLARKIYKVGKQ